MVLQKETILEQRRIYVLLIGPLVGCFIKRGERLEHMCAFAVLLQVEKRAS